MSVFGRLLHGMLGGRGRRGPRAIAELLQEGARLQSAGNFAGAERCYRRALDSQPGNPDALHLLGRLKGQGGDYPAAEGFLRALVAAAPDMAEAHCDLGVALQAQGRLAEAERSYREALRLDPASTAAQCNLAALLQRTQGPEAALAPLRAAHAAHPDDARIARQLAATLVEAGFGEEAVSLLEAAGAQRGGDAPLLTTLATVHAALGRLDAAVEAAHRALEADPASGEVHHCLGLLAWKQGRADDAQKSLLRATELDPRNAKAHSDLGLLLHQLGRDEEALDSFHMALHHQPGFGEARRGLGQSLLACGRVQEARAAFQQDIASAPHPESWFGLARSFQTVGELEAAEAAYRRALELDPGMVKALNNLGLVYRELGRFAEAAEVLRRALQLAPDFLPARANLGLAHYDMAQMEAAVACFERVLAEVPDYDEALWNLAVARLSVGDFARGWEDYDKRWLRKEASRRPYSFPEWQGESLSGKRILVYTEQGLGDEIMFASCLPEVIARAAACHVECDPRLQRLFARSFPQATVHGGKSKDGSHARPERYAGLVDVQTPIGNLPRHFRRSWEEFPQHQGYLRADPERVAHWRGRLEALGPGLKIGISWRGGTPHSRRRLRSISLGDLAPILSLPGVQCCSLQYGDCAADLQALAHERGITLAHWQEAIDDYDETAALVSALDLVVSVCTAVIHLAGALGREAWVMVPASPEWRYLRAGERMPWYTAVRLFRQQHANDWQPVLDAVQRKLRERAAAHAPAGAM